MSSRHVYVPPAFVTVADSKYLTGLEASSVARARARIPVSHQHGLTRNQSHFWFSQPPGAPVRAIRCHPSGLNFSRSDYLFRSFESNPPIPYVSRPGGRPQQVFRPTVYPYINHRNSWIQKDVVGAQYIPDKDEDDDSEVDSLQREPNELHHFHLSNYRDLDRVGAYSPNTRRRRVDRYLEKRKRKKWKRTVKYQVRKAFALQRAREGGRFVKAAMYQCGNGDKSVNPAVENDEVPRKAGHSDPPPHYEMSTFKSSLKTFKKCTPQNSNQGTCEFCGKKNIGALGTHRRFCPAIPGEKLNSNRGDCKRCGRRNIGALGTHLRFCTGVWQDPSKDRLEDTVGPEDVLEVKA